MKNKNTLSALSPVIDKIRTKLKDAIDEKTRETSQHFFKEKITFYGVKVPTVNKIGKSVFSSHNELSKEDIFSICEELWKSGVLEESFIACNWSYYLKDTYVAGDFDIFARWLNLYVNNWASCDTLCNHTIGTLLEKCPEKINKLKAFCSSSNRWVRRGAAVSLIIPARKGLFLNDLFEIADKLMTDEDDLVQKGYGWMLKAAGESHRQEVFSYVIRNKAVMPRTALRYAIEKMPPELRSEALKKS